MILIQVILIVAFLFLVLKLVANPSSYQVRAWQKIIGIIFFIVAIFAVLFPNSLNSVAHFLGVGRGVDLLLYLLTLTFIFVTFNLYLKDKLYQRRIVQLARKVAIIEANQKPRNIKIQNSLENRTQEN